MRAQAIGSAAQDRDAARPAAGFAAALARAAGLSAGGSRHGSPEVISPGIRPGRDLRARAVGQRARSHRTDTGRRLQPQPAAGLAHEPVAARAVRDADATAAPTPIPPASLERIAVVARMQGDRTSVELRLGADLYVRVSGGNGGGVDLVLDPSTSLARWAESELPRVVTALRERGVRVASAVVGRVRQAGRAALTSPQASATTARSSPAHGTVAKW